MLAGFLAVVLAVVPDDRPNVLLIVSDDQGWGDVGSHGNPVLKTPNLDRLAAEGVELTQFHAMPVCSPTRAGLMTGRYAYRTGVVDTYLGRSLMHADELTIAEALRAAGYRTGIFGKWHLGDNAPLRAIDQGFDEALVLRGGGIGQPSDPPGPGGSSYTDPILQHNGREERRQGYCSDVYTTAALDFVASDPDRPFFAYVAFNAPHTPLQVPDDGSLDRYRAADLSAVVGQPPAPKGDPETIARIYAMVENLDANVGRLLEGLSARGLDRRTIVVFLTDNGPQQPRYNAGLRGLKGTVYQGGLRVPCLVRWPGHLPGGTKIDRIASHIDLMPTLLAACRVPLPDGSRPLDGVNLLPLLDGSTPPSDWPDRPLFFQWHRGDVPQARRNFAVRTQRYKLLRPEAAHAAGLPVEKSLFLYDLASDPSESRDVAADHPAEVARLLAAYDAWFASVSAERQFAPPRIAIGHPAEEVTVLTRQDWRGPRAGWNVDDLGYWDVEVVRTGNYAITIAFEPSDTPSRSYLTIGGLELELAVPSGSCSVRFEVAGLEIGKTRLRSAIARDGRESGVKYVEIMAAEAR